MSIPGSKDIWMNIISKLINSYDFSSVLELSQSCKQLRAIVFVALQPYSRDQLPHDPSYCDLGEYLLDLNTSHKENRFFTNFRLKYKKSICEKKLGSKNSGQNLMKYILWREQRGNLSECFYDEWEPPYYKLISNMCESGNSLPFSEDLFSFVSQFVPQEEYIISSCIDYPRILSSDDKWKTWLLDEPRNIEKKFHLPHNVLGHQQWRLERYKINICLLHSVWDEERVDYYKRTMEESYYKIPEYIPTVLVLTPIIYVSYGGHIHSDGVVLDGHHKIQAAAEIGCPVRVILIEMNNQTLLEVPDDEDNDNDSMDDIEFYQPKLRNTRNSKKIPSIQKKEYEYLYHTFKHTL